VHPALVSLAVAWLAAAPAAAPVDTGPDGPRVHGVTFSEALRSADGAPRERGLHQALKLRHERDSDLRGMEDPLEVTFYPGARINPRSEVGPQLQLQITQSIPLERLGAARRRAAKAEREELSIAADAARLQRRLDVARAWLDDWALREQSRLLGRELKASERWVEATRKLLDAGESTRTELATARGWKTEVELEALAVEGMVHHAGLRLAELVGVSSVDPVLAVGEPPIVDLTAADLRRVAEGADELPATVAPRLAAAAARAREVEMRAAAGWKLDLGGMAQVDQPEPAIGVFGQVGVRIPIWGRNRRGQALERGQAARFQGEAEEQSLRTAREIRDALHELRHTEEQVEALENRLVPALEEVTALEVRSLSLGESTTRRVVEARRSSLAAHRRLAAARGEHAWAELRVWLLLAALEGSEWQERSR
jgi:cobalt-zinc-cadmium efflux system outer membrane protein